MIKQFHLAAQYLATAGRSFVEVKSDDSHTNVEWNAVEKRLESRFFGDNLLALHYPNFSLQWLSNGNVTEEVSLDGKSHGEIVKWMEVRVEEAGLPGYQYDLHYDLPYDSITEDFQFEQPPVEVTQEQINRLTLAKNAFSKFLSMNNFESEICIWPHHFDLGLYTQVKFEIGLYLGIGLAVPDSMVNEQYVYVSGWMEGKNVSVEDFQRLSNGDWQTGNWNGATLPIAGKNEEDLVNYMNEALFIFEDNSAT